MKIEADRVESERLATLEPYNASLNALTASGRITVARRREIEAAVVEGKTAEMLLKTLADNPMKGQEKTGVQAGSSANPVLDWVNQQQAANAGV